MDEEFKNNKEIQKIIKRERKITLITLLIILVVTIGAFLVIWLYPKNKGISEDFVRCLSNKTTLYIKNGCVSCERQIKVFGELLNLLNVVDCGKEPKRCINADITAVPIWEINNQTYKGYKTIEELKELINC